MHKNTIKIFKGGITGVLSTFLIITIFSFMSQAAETSKTTVNPFVGAKYVGSEKCKDCHWEEYYSWKGTLHTKKVQPVDEYTVIGDFVKNNKLTLKVTEKAPELGGQEVTTTMFKKDGKFYVNTIGPDKKSYDYEILYVIGITWKQRYITKFPNGEMHVLPVQWNIQTQKWVDYHGLEKHYPGDGAYWSDSARPWQLKCGSCHVTGLTIGYDAKKDRFDTTWADFGAACEACHGPGSNHVDALNVYFKGKLETTSKPAEYIKAAAETIVNPAKLPWWSSAMVCGQCHNRGESTADVSPYKEGFPKKYGYPYGFLPGNALYLYYIEKPGLWPDGSSKQHHQQYNDWKKSEHARAKITCIQCHTMHKNPTKPQAELTGDKLCRDCHTTAKPVAVHRIHTFGSCLDCHMSRVAKSAVSGVEGAIFGDIRSHTVKFISPELSLKAGGVDKQPNSCSNCHYHKDTPLTDLVEWLDAVKKADMPKPFSAHRKEESTKPEEYVK
ncbi:MAG: hypothetical protein HY752_01915 [Nitrospirae bacterium]|nr:hypothetical protein [Nitrospirota bacterium]